MTDRSKARIELRAALVALTRALEERDAGVETIVLGLRGLVVTVDSSLEDAEERQEPVGFVVPPPNGLWEWATRRDFVRAMKPGKPKTRLGTTLGGPKTRRRFEIALDVQGGTLRADFVRFRRRRLRAYAVRVLRYVIQTSSGAEAS